MSLPDGTLIEYVVDGRNRRIGKKVNGVLEKGWLHKIGGLQKDPLGFESRQSNLYVYVLNDPVNFTDPDGRITLHIGTDKNLQKEARNLPEAFGALKPIVEESAKCVDRMIHHDVGGPDGDLILKPNVDLDNPGVNLEYKW